MPAMTSRRKRELAEEQLAQAVDHALDVGLTTDALSAILAWRSARHIILEMMSDKSRKSVPPTSTAPMAARSLPATEGPPVADAHMAASATAPVVGRNCRDCEHSKRTGDPWWDLCTSPNVGGRCLAFGAACAINYVRRGEGHG